MKKNNWDVVKGREDATHQLVLTALLFAVAIVLAIVETMLPSLPIPVPGVKFGLSNVAVMYALFFVGWKRAYGIAVLKGFFVFVTRGAIGSLLSLIGGILSVSVMILLLILFRKKITYVILSIFGAVFHNLGQFIGIMVLYTGMSIWAYLPVLIIAGIVAGIFTAMLLRFVLPAFARLE